MDGQTDIENQKQRTLSLSIREGVVWSVMAGFGDLFLSPYAIFLGAGNRAIAILSTMPHLLGAFAQMLGASLTDRLRKRRALIAWMAFLQGLTFLPLAAVPYFIEPAHAVAIMLLLVGLNTFTGNAVAPAWTSMMGDVVPDDSRGAYFGKRGSLVILVVFISQLVAGGVLEGFEKSGRVQAGFVLIFIVAAVARTISAWLLARHYDPPYEPPREAWFSFFQFISRIRQSNFARFALYFALLIGATNVAAPFFTVYMLRDLGWGYGEYTINQAVFLAVQFVMIRWWGRIGDRHGNRVVLSATGLIMGVLPVLWVFSTNYFYLLFVQVLAGTAWSGFSIAAQNFTFDSVTPHKRARISSYVSLLNGICAVVGSTVIGAWLANHLPSSVSAGGFTVQFTSSLPFVFIASSVCRMTVFLVMVSKFREVRAINEPLHPAELILRLAGGQAVAMRMAGLLRRIRPPAARRGSSGDGSEGGSG